MRSMIDILMQKGTDDFRTGLSTFLNPYSYYFLRNKRNLLLNFDNILIDGIALAILLRLVGIRLSRRSFDFTSLAPIVFDFAQIHKLKVAVVGGTQTEIVRFKEAVSSAYPSVKIEMAFNGYFSDSVNRQDVLRKIASAGSDIVVVGLGAGMQEQFLVDLKSLDWNGYGFTCGGFITQVSRRGLNYYPRLFDKLQARWLFRMIEDGSLISRYLISYPKFLFYFTIDVIKYFRGSGVIWKK